jgi:hypothetical protein
LRPDAAQIFFNVGARPLRGPQTASHTTRRPASILRQILNAAHKVLNTLNCPTSHRARNGSRATNSRAEHNGPRLNFANAIGKPAFTTGKLRQRRKSSASSSPQRGLTHYAQAACGSGYAKPRHKRRSASTSHLTALKLFRGHHASGFILLAHKVAIPVVCRIGALTITCPHEISHRRTRASDFIIKVHRCASLQTAIGGNGFGTRLFC